MSRLTELALQTQVKPGALAMPESKARADGLIGRTLGEFVVREKVGEGGFGVVFRAEQPLLAREAVIKVLQSRAPLSANTVQRFLREARLASSLDHPYAAHIYAFGAEPDGLLWIAMELVRGSTLDNLLKVQGPLPLARFVPLFDRLCEVVHTAHEQGIIHRDLKPANVMVLSRAGRLLPKLLDLGVAKLREESEAEGNTRGGEETAREGLSPEGISESLAKAASTQLTERGLFIGSPHYMAPEQWVNAASADPRTDVYALGVLCYESLTGRRPFDGHTVLDIARGHARKPVPPLGSEFPNGLLPVLQRAMAKKGVDRFPTALELCAAFRAASGLTEEPVQLPQLEETVRETMIASAPQPLAEAVGALEGARTVTQALDATAQAFRIVARWTGLLALACRAKIGAGGAPDSGKVLEHLVLLRRQSLTDREWLGLARELCRPFARIREAYPIPELISLFFEPGGDIESTNTHLFEIAPQAESASSEEGKRDLLGRELPRLAQLLRSTSFFSEYELVVPRESTAESWNGVRRNPRPSRTLRAHNLTAHQPVLIDRAGVPLLSLWPLAQVMPPNPGAPDELFVLEGTGRHGAKLVATPLGFERHDEALWSWSQKHLVDLSGESAARPAEERAPYLGLATFTRGDIQYFFGREREAEAFANRLRVQPLLAVVGPSGAGKSSFIQAGVLPLLPANWRAFTLRPGTTPLAALAARLVQGGMPLSRSEIAQRPEAVGEMLRERARQSATTLVLVVDQFEELLTLCPDPSERELFARALVAAATTAEEPARVILTLRDDFLIRVQQLPSLRDRLAQGLQLLGTPAPDDLLRILIQPARKVGYQFEDPQLPEEMVKEVADQPGALALLSFTASRLWDLRDRQFQLLSRRAFHSLGGVGGALAQHAELTLDQMPSDERLLVREAFRHLVTPERTRAVLTRREMEEVLAGGAVARHVLERLIGARLLVASEAPGGEDRIEVIHEALLTSWPRLIGWHQEDAENARMRHQLRAAARQWEERRRGKGLLWRKEALMEYRLWRARSPGRLTETEEAFAAASLAEEVRVRRLQRFAITGAFFALAVGLVVLFRANKTASESLTSLYLEEGRQLVLAGDPIRAMLYLDKAYQSGASGPSLQFLIGRATRSLDAQIALLPHGDRVVEAQFSPDGRRAVTASWDQTAKLWNASNGKLIAELKGHTGRVLTARFSPDGDRIVTASLDGTARVWDGAQGAPIASLELASPAPEFHIYLQAQAEFSPDGQHIAAAIGDVFQIWDARRYQRNVDVRIPAEQTDQIQWIENLRFHPDGQSLFTGRLDGVLNRWDLRGRQLFSIHAHQSTESNLKRVSWMSLSRDGSRLATVGWDGFGRVWEVDTSRLLSAVPEPEGQAHGVALSPDGTTLVTASDSKIAKVWDARSGSVLRFVEGHTSAVRSVAYSPNGQQFVTTSGDGTAKVWSAAGGAALATLVGHVDTVNSAQFAPDGAHLITASNDSSARIWNAGAGPRLWSIEEPSFVSFAGFSRDNQSILIADQEGGIKLLDAETGKLASRLQLKHDLYHGAAWSPDGSRLALAGNDATLLVEIPSGRLVATLPPIKTRTVLSLAFSPDRQRLACGDEDGMVRIRDGRDGKLLLSLAGHSAQIKVVAFDRQGVRLASGGLDKKVIIWDVQTGARLLTLDDFRGEVRSVDFSPDGSQLVTASRDKRLIIWDARTGRLLLQFEEAKWSNINWAQFSPDGAMLATADVAGAAAFWDARAGKLLSSHALMAGPLAAARFSSDGHKVISAMDQNVTVWDAQRDDRSRGEISSYVRCRVPFRLEQDKLVQGKLDLAACR